MGFLVMDEAFDKWFGDFTAVDPGEPFLYQYWMQDLSAMLVRDRNHPSIMLWSVGNEAGTPGSVEHDTTLKQLVDFVHQLEPTRPVTCALVPVDDTPENTVAGIARSASLVDVLAVNYQEAFFDRFRAAVPNIPMLSTESFPFYARTIDGIVDTDTLTPSNPWFDVVNRDFVAGEFVWNGIDHMGESVGWPSKGWANGLFNSCAFPKPAVSFFKTVWRSEPSVWIYVLSDTIDIDLGFAPWRWPKSAQHWNFAGLENHVLQLNTISNCDTVELIVNGESMGELRPLDFPNWTIPWFVPYVAGTVQAIGRNGGVPATSHLLQTAGPPAQIEIHADHDTIAADGIEVTHIEATLQDSNGILVPDHDLLLSFLVNGPANLIGVDNGDQRSLESYQGSSRTTFQGRALAVIQSTGAPGPIIVLAFADGLPLAAAGVLALR
jgi:beta-galactosidase